MVGATIRGRPGMNDAQRGQLRHYGGQLRHDAGSGLGLESRWLDPRQPSSGKPVRLRLRKLNITLQQLKHQLISDRLCMGWANPTAQTDSVEGWEGTAWANEFSPT